MNQKTKIAIIAIACSSSLVVFTALTIVLVVMSNKRSKLAFGMKTLELPSHPLKQNMIETIPKTIHRIWMKFKPDASVQIPKKYTREITESKKNTKGWENVLWRDKEAENLTQSLFPKLYPLYMAYQKPMQKGDAFRYTMLHTYGGFYSDMDLIIHDLDGLLKRYPNKKAFFFIETYLNEQQIEDSKNVPIRNGEPEHPERISNYFMGCVPNHPIMLDIIEEVMKRASLKVKQEYDVIYTTGPDVVTTVVQRNRHKYPDLMVLSKQEADEFITHYAAGSWRGF